MKLTSENDYRLLRNIICIKKAVLETKSPEQKDALEIYNNLLYLLNSGNTVEVNRILNNLSNNQDFTEFTKNISSKSNQELATEYVNIIKSFNSSEEKFSRFLEVFFKNNEELNPYASTKDLTQLYLKNLGNLLNKNTPKNTPSKFIDFSRSYANNTKKLATEVYKKYFNKNNKELLNMEIAYGQNPNVPTYLTNLTLSDNNTSEITNLKLEEIAPPSGFASTYYQNLCGSYLEPYKCSKTDENSITEDFIQTKTNNFRKYYEGLKAMMNCKIAISNGKFMCYAITHKTPGEQPEKTSSEYEER